MSAQTPQRRQIMAMFRGPGPACVNLSGSTGYIGHDCTKHRKPMYSFGLKVRSKSMYQSPGPVYLVPPTVTRCGMEGTPKYSLHDRTPLSCAFKTPAPGAYAPEKHETPKHQRAPAYSFGSRTPFAKRDAVPAPNNYKLPTVMGPKSVGKLSLPAYSMTGRSKIGSFHEDLQRTPGPGTYKVHDVNASKKRYPSYSMLSRSYAPGDGTMKPGPGAHSPEKYYTTKRQAPRFSFGIRHSEYTAPLIVDPVD